MTIREIRQAIEGLPDDAEVGTLLTMDTSSAFMDNLWADVVSIDNDDEFGLVFIVSCEMRDPEDAIVIEDEED